MEKKIFCPKCKTALSINSISYSCKKCNNPSVAKIRTGYIDFINDTSNETQNQQLTKLLEVIDKKGFSDGVKQFLIEFPELQENFTNKSQTSDIIYHGLSKQNSRCLDIGSNFGNITEHLTNFFDEVYSLETDPNKIEFQKKRFAFNNKKNITLLRSNVNNLPFPNDFFDLIIFNSIGKTQNFISQILKKDTQIQCLTELRRIIKQDGCILIGTFNKQGKNLIKSNEYKLKPNIFNEYGTKHANYNDYKNLLTDVGFNFKSYWVYPSLNRPYYSGRIGDKKTLQWFFSNLDNFIPTFKKKGIKQSLILFCLKIFPKNFVNFLIKYYCPSFVFCCHKSSEVETLDDLIPQNNGFKNFLFISRPLKIFYILFDSNNSPKKIASLKKFIPNSQKTTLNNKPNKKYFSDIEKQFYIYDWKDGRLLDPLNPSEVLIAVQWMIDFQKKYQQNEFTKVEISKEILSLKQTIVKYSQLNKPSFFKLIDDYEQIMKNAKIKKTSIHGDLSHKNMIINPKSNKLEVIDRFYFNKIGNPLDDISIFLFRLLLKSKKLSKIESFRTKILDNDEEFINLKEKIEGKFSEHLNFKFDLIFIMKIYLLKIISTKIQKNLNFDEQIKYLRILTKCN